MPISTFKKRILVTSARFPVCLDLVRQLHSAGHEVYTADSLYLTAARFSNAVKKSFKVPSPRLKTQEYIQSLIRIIKDEKIDFLLPTFEEVFYISAAQDQFPKECEVFCSPHKTLTDLHNKWIFNEKLRSYNLPTLPAILIQSEKDLQTIPLQKPYILKSCFSRGSLSIAKVEDNKPHRNIPFDSKNPLIAQSWGEGTKYCTYSICYQGKIYAHTTYPVEFAIDGNSCISFKAIRHPEILSFVTTFVEKENYTGQIAFDFIEDDHGTLFCLECNPRTTSGLHLFDAEDCIADAFFHRNETMITPPENRSKQIAIAMLVWGWRNGNPSLALPQFLKKICSTKDVIFTTRDPLPFLMEPVLFPVYLATSIAEGLSMPASFTSDLEWNG